MASAAVVTNLLESATLTPDAEDTNFPRANLVDKIAAKRFSFDATTGGNIDIDLGSAQSFDTIALINHNLTSGASVVVKVGSSSPAATTVLTMTYRATSMWGALGTQSYRYIRIEVTDTNTEDVAIGQLVIGARVTLPRASRFGDVPGKDRADIVHKTERGAIYAYLLYEVEVRDYTWRVLASEITNFETVDNTVQGRIRPFVWIEDTTAAEVLYVRRAAASFRPAELDNLEAYDIDWRLQGESNGASVED